VELHDPNQCARSITSGGAILDQERIGVVLTIWMEALLPKRRILELYANVIEMGRGICGVEAASRYYLASTRGLTREQSAVLAAILRIRRLGSPGIEPDVTMASATHSATRTERARFPEKLLH
jgi:monofunctional biosynthetic peptidoglycan transglycosylase